MSIKNIDNSIKITFFIGVISFLFMKVFNILGEVGNQLVDIFFVILVFDGICFIIFLIARGVYTFQIYKRR
jgi:hypothetical protein